MKKRCLSTACNGCISSFVVVELSYIWAVLCRFWRGASDGQSLTVAPFVRRGGVPDGELVTVAILSLLRLDGVSAPMMGKAASAIPAGVASNRKRFTVVYLGSGVASHERSLPASPLLASGEAFFPPIFPPIRFSCIALHRSASER